MRLSLMLLGMVLVFPLAAQTGLLSPRESYDNALLLFGQGHVFTPDELQSLDTLRGKLSDAGDTDLAGEVAVLRMAALAHADHENANQEAAANLVADAQSLVDAAARQRDKNGWRITRDVGLYTFTAATAATLLLAVTNNQEEAWLHNGLFVDFKAKQNFNRSIGWATLGSAGLMLISLFPLLMGQANQ